MSPIDFCHKIDFSNRKYKQKFDKKETVIFLDVLTRTLKETGNMTREQELLFIFKGKWVYNLKNIV